MSFGYYYFMRVLLGFLVLSAFLAGCGGQSTEDKLRGRLEGFFEAVLTGDAASLDNYISDSCPQKAEFLELASEAPAFGDVEVEVPEGSFLFDVEGHVAVAKRSRNTQSVLVNGEPFEDDPSNDVPLKLVEEDGVWRVENCGAFVSA